MSTLTLYAAAADVVAALDAAFDPETGEALPAFEEARSLFVNKAQAVIAYRLNLLAEAKAAAEVAKTIGARAKSAQRRADALDDYLLQHMTATGITSIKADDGSFSAKLEQGRDKSVDVFDAAQLPDDYLREVPARYEADKTLIRKAMDAGFDVPCARLVARDRLTIR